MNNKGKKLLDFLRQNESCMLQKKRISHKIDHVLESANNIKLVEDCQEETPSTTFRNHQSLRVMMRLRSPKKTSEPKKKINSHKFIDSENKDDFNRKLKSILAIFLICVMMNL